MSRKPERDVYAVETESYDIEEQMSLTGRAVREDGRLLFSTIMQRATARMEIIVSFMALLELIKLGTVLCIQDAAFDDILILPRLPERLASDASAPLAPGRGAPAVLAGPAAPAGQSR